MKDLSKTIMHPVRMRIIQYLRLHGRATVAQLGTALSDVPKATLYRNVRLLQDSGVLETAQEERKRGAVQRTLRLAGSDSLLQAHAGDETAFLKEQLRSALFVLVGEFERYLAQPEPDFYRDKVGVHSALLWLNDSEVRQLLTDYGKLLERYMNNEKREDRRLIRLASTSLAVKEDEDE